MINDSLIYDVGAHIGEDTEFYLKKGFHVVAIEAVPELCGALNDKFSESVASGRLKILILAVSKSAGVVDFYVDDKISVWGTTNWEWVKRNRALGAGNVRKISVGAERLSDIMKEYGVPRYCKIDIEGNDLEALATLESLDEKPRFVSIESEKREWYGLLKEFEVFEHLGYSKYKVVDQSFVRLQKCPTPPSEGSFQPHTFEEGSSGLFGNELPGRWLNLFEALEAYRNIFRGYALGGDNGIFHDRLSFFSLIGRVQELSMRMRGNEGYRLVQLPPAGWYDTHAAR